MIEVGAGPEGGRPGDLWSHWKLVFRRSNINDHTTKEKPILPKVSSFRFLMMSPFQEHAEQLERISKTCTELRREVIELKDTSLGPRKALPQKMQKNKDHQTSVIIGDSSNHLGSRLS